MIAWYRLQFPDASVFNLDNMGRVVKFCIRRGRPMCLPLIEREEWSNKSIPLPPRRTRRFAPTAPLFLAKKENLTALDNMGAVDLAGYAGIHDKVNNHTWKIFKNVFLLSIIGAGAQIAIGDGGDDKDSPLNVSKSEMGRQFGQVGTEMIKRNMNIQPTLEIRPSYLFNIMVNKDLILSPYQ